MITDYLTIISICIVVIVLYLLIFKNRTIKTQLLNQIETRKRKKEINIAYDKMKTIKNLKTVSFACNLDDNKSKILAHKIFNNDTNTIEMKENINTIYDIAREINKNKNLDNSIIFMSTNCNEIGKVSEISDLVNPQIGIITDIESKALDIDNMENILKAKYEIIEVLPTEGIAIFNYDDKYIKKLADKTFKEKILYGIENEELDFYAYNIEEYDDEMTFIVSNNKENIEFRTKIKDRENVLVILGSIVVCNVLGLSLEEISKRIKNIEEI